MNRYLLTITILLVFSIALLAQTQMTIADFEQEVWRLTNVERGKYNLAPLYYDTGLAALAKRHSLNMYQKDFFAHRDPWGDEVAGRKNKYYPELIVSSIGENLGKFSNSRRVFIPQEVVSGWMNSPAHRANILDAGFTHIGIGLVFKGNEMYATQDFATPIVKLVSELPDKIDAKYRYRLRFEYIAGQATQGFSSTLIYPNPNATYRISEDQEMCGAQPIPIQWISDRSFEVEVPFLAGKGNYQLSFGYNGGYFPEGVLISVR